MQAAAVTFTAEKASNHLMAFRLQDHDDLGDMAEINVTPLVDVMLVLLIIFMVTAPMLTQGLEVSLPPAEGKSFELATNNPSKITITSAGAVYVDGAAVGSRDLDMTLGTMLRAKRIRRALLEADQSVPYGRVVAVLDIMNKAGVEQLGMVTQPVEIDARSRR
jgi:biopolymer transport protein TolR